MSNPTDQPTDAPELTVAQMKQMLGDMTATAESSAPDATRDLMTLIDKMRHAQTSEEHFAYKDCVRIAIEDLQRERDDARRERDELRKKYQKALQTIDELNDRIINGEDEG